MALSGFTNEPFTVNLASLGIPIGADQVITFTTDYPNNNRTYLGVYYRSGIQVSPLSIPLNNAAPNGSITITPFAPGPYIIPYTISSAFTPHCGEYTGFIDVLVTIDLIVKVRVGGSFVNHNDIINSDTVTIAKGPLQPGRDLHISGSFILLKCAFGSLRQGFSIPNVTATGYSIVTSDANYIYVDYDITIVNGSWPVSFSLTGCHFAANSNSIYNLGCTNTNCAIPYVSIVVTRNSTVPNITTFKLVLRVQCTMYWT